MKKIYFKTAEFARLCGTTKETLRHYDEIDLLKPRYVGENKYRYYETSQFETFYLIAGLKDIGFSLDYIKAQMSIKNSGQIVEESVNNYCDLLKAQEKVIEAKIKQLKETQKSITTHVQGMQKYLQHETGNVFMDEMSKQFCLISKDKLDFENKIAEAHFDFSQLLTKLKEYSKNSYHGYGAIKTREQIEQKQNYIYERIYYKSPKAISNYTIAAGRFLCLYEHTDFENILPSYGKIIDFADKNNIKIDDVFYEDIILSQVQREKEQNTYIIQIRVRILE